MGIIYKLTSPSNKIYIGQTIKTIEKRFREHLEDATRIYKNHCIVLNKSLRKYGGFHFKLEILEECLDEELNEKEIEYILKYDTQTPKGMNIKLGGSSGKHHEDTKKRIANSLKGRIVSSETKTKLSNTTNPDLPMYIVKCKNGYRVCNHPMGPEKRFLRNSDDNLTRAITYLQKLNETHTPLSIKSITKERYIQKHGSCYCVKYSNLRPKYFVSKQLSNEELYSQASKYLNEIKKIHECSSTT